MKKQQKKWIMIILSVTMLFSFCGITAFAESEELPDLVENSWRYQDGQLIDAQEKGSSKIRLMSTQSSWSKTENGFVNDNGTVIAGATKKGIDVSHHQGYINWDAVKNTDVDYAIIRCGFGDNYEKYDDSQWLNNANACTRLGIPFGAYLYSYAASTQEAESEAEHAIRLLSGYDLSYPVYLDLEDDKSVGTCSNEMIGQIANIFCTRLQAAGYKVGIYANKYWWTTKLTSSVFNNESWYKWVAQYNSTCTYTGSYTMWQATSSGSVSGISGNVDIDFWFGNDMNIEDTTDYSYPNTYINTGEYSNDIVGVANTQIGYTELDKKGGTPVIDSETPYYTKYGERYGNPNGHWCAFFVLWCAEQANIPTSIICKSASCGSCNYFVNWFKQNHRWKDNSYIPIKGDIIFYDWNGDSFADHVGIVDGVTDNYILTIEGNTGGVNGYTVMKRNRFENILGYGNPDYALKDKINGYATKKAPAYMLPDSSSQTVWEIWENDELQVLCRDGDYYLVLYPYVYTGKFVAAYVPVDAVNLTGTVLNADSYYNISKNATVKNNTVLYHNASTDDLMGGTNNNKVRASLNVGDKLNALFYDNDFAFVRNDSISGYISLNDIEFERSNTGDINGDELVNSADAGLILRYDAGIISLSDLQLFLSDINNDKKVDSADAGLILRYDAGIINKLQ